uniref:Uncharacterized protein n=1 Tax=Rhizophora mucronata TaxID=61149 RepID=A0A2P2NRH2_RHIMU
MQRYTRKTKIKGKNKETCKEWDKMGAH